MARNTIGRCLLTGEVGLYANAHILPRFLADKALGQAHRIQFGEGARPQLRFNSWSDREIVGHKGEERLRDIDTAAARIIRRHGLGWRHFPLDVAAQRTLLADGMEMIVLREVDTATLRLFFLSLLWRSAVSTRVEFAEITLPPTEIDLLRAVLMNEAPADPADFPAVAILLTTAGEPQVHAPLAQTIDMKSLGFDAPPIPIFRFFLDGFVIHIGRKSKDTDLLSAWQPRVVGTSGDLHMIGRPYEGSAQEGNLRALKQELHANWPDQALSIYRTLWKIDSGGPASK